MEGAGAQTRSIGMDALFQYTGTGVQFFSGMMFYIIIVRIFSTPEVGAIALFIAIIGLFNVIFSLGLGTAAQHFTSFSVGTGDHHSAARTFYKIIGYGFTLSIAGFATLLMMTPLISDLFLHSELYVGLIRILSLVVLGNVLFGILNGTLLGLQRFRASAVVNIIIWIVYYFGSIALSLLVHTINFIIIGWVIGIFLGVFIELIVIINLISKFKSGGKSVSGHTLFKYSLPIVMSSMIAYGASYVDRFIVAGLMTLSSLGIYNFALLIASSIGFLAVPFNNILLTKFSEFYGRGEKNAISIHVKASTLLLSSIYVPVAVGISSLSPMIIELLGGANYDAGVLPLSFVMIMSALFISQNILTQSIASVRKTSVFIYTFLAAFASNLVISYTLIPIFGLMGAAIGFTSVYAATFIPLVYFTRREGIFGFDYLGNLKIWLASAIMFVVVTMARNIFGGELILLPLYILLGTAIYIGFARTLHFFRRESKDLVLSLFPDRYKAIRRILTFLIVS